MSSLTSIVVSSTKPAQLESLVAAWNPAFLPYFEYDKINKKYSLIYNDQNRGDLGLLLNDMVEGIRNCAQSALTVQSNDNSHVTKCGQYFVILSQIADQLTQMQQTRNQADMKQTVKKSLVAVARFCTGQSTENQDAVLANLAKMYNSARNRMMGNYSFLQQAAQSCPVQKPSSKEFDERDWVDTKSPEKTGSHSWVSLRPEDMTLPALLGERSHAKPLPMTTLPAQSSPVDHVEPSATTTPALQLSPRDTR